MSDNILFNVQHTIEENPRYRFWFWQIGFWFFMGVLGFFTLILWYAEASRESVGHVTVQAILGLVCSLLLHQAFTALSKYSLTIRIFIGFLLVLSTAFLWTFMHMQVYVLLTGFEAVWEEFGGWYFSGIFIFLCWTGLFHGVRYYDLMQFEHRIMLKAEANTREEHLKRVRAQSEARDAKLKMLRYQLNPHFLCNSLNAINSLIEIGESAKAQLMTVQLSEFLRYSLDTDPDAKITLLDEIDALNLYLEIEKTRFEERLNIIIQIAPSAQFALLPSLLLQPLIENSMKHAIGKSESGGTISIIASTTKTELVLIVMDTGNRSLEETQHNMDKNLATRKGVGLANIKQRLSALYQDAYGINTEFESSGGLTTTIHLPLEFEKKAG
jgi:sensor histidine kinase YesM